MLSRKSKIIESNKDLICNLLIKKGYIINLETPELFTKLKPLQVESIKRDSKSINFMPSINNDDVFNLILEYCPEQLFKTSIKYFDNELVKEKILNITSNEIYNLILESINKGIDINNLNKFIIVLAEKMYERERISSPEVFTNVYANTMTLLDQCNSSYDFELNWSIYHDGYLQNAYGSEYTRTVIKELIKDYYKHKNNNQSTSNELKEIAKICREFNDKYKQSAIKRNIRRIRDTLLKYNIVKVNKDGPKIRKLIKEKKQRELFFNQCQSNDKYKDILEEIRNKVKTNIKTDYVLKEDEIDEIIDNIFLNKELNITEPLRYQDLLTKIEIDKVINRLNNKNIDEYNKDYIKYKDYIKCKIINNKKVYYSLFSEFNSVNKYRKLKSIVHHGDNRLDHINRVAKISFLISKALGLDYISCTRGAMMHDFFTIDDINRGSIKYRKYLNNHSYKALSNSLDYFEVNEVEEDIILSHMYPLCKNKPSYKESHVVCICDKIVSIYEFFRYQLKTSVCLTLIFCFKIVY